MKTMNPEIERNLQEGLRHLHLTAKNEQLLREYLFREQRDEAILNSVDHQINFGSVSERFYYPFLRACSDANAPGGMDRLLEFLWAVGGVSVTHLLAGTHMGFLTDRGASHCGAHVLGVAPTAVLAAAGAYSCHYLNNRNLHFLFTAAQTVPEELRKAQSLCTHDEDHAYSLIAAVLLCREDDAQQREALVRRTVDAIPKILFGLPMGEMEAAQHYIRSGDLDAPVPILPSLQCPAVDTASALEAKWSEQHFLRTYGLAAMLTARQDARMRCALRFLMTLDPRNVFKAATDFLPFAVVQTLLPVLTEELPGGVVTMLLLATDIHYQADMTEKWIMEVCQAHMLPAMRAADCAYYSQLILYTEVRLEVPELRAKLAGDLSRATAPGGEEDAYRFLMAQGDLTDAVKQLRKVKEGSNKPMIGARGVLSDYLFDLGVDDFALRCMTYLGLVQDNPCFDTICMRSGKIDEDLLARVYQGMLERGLPIREVLKAADKVYAGTYDESDRASLRRAILTVKAADHVSAYADAVKKGSVFLRGLCLELLDALAEEPGAKEGILAAMGDSSKQIQEQVIRTLSRKGECAADVAARLTAKKASERIVAVEALGRMGRHEVLAAALAEEKNAKVSDAILAVLGSAAGAAVGSPKELAEGIVKGGKLKKLSWLICDSLQTVRNADGTPADDVIRNAILLSYCELGRIGRSDTAAELAKGLDAADLQKLAVQVYDLWFAAGAQAKNKWVLPFAAVFGGTAMTERLRKAIHDWPEHQRGAIACDAVMALAMSTDPAAIVIVDAISRKFKFRQVKQAAALALENAARELGITAEELADRIVPDLGFGKDGRRVFDYGKRSFTVRLTPTLELSITNDQGKAVKNLPAPGKTDEPRAADAYEEFKAMKKAIKTTVTAQRARLESALSVLRCWDTDRWQALFVGNPIMHQFAMSLIWGIYEDGRLTDTFRYMEDGSFNTVDEEEYTLPENGKIGLVHPVELDADTLDGWKQQLEDYEIRQSIDQLSRSVHALDQEKAGEKSLEDFGGKKLNALSLSGKLLQQGWYRGSVVDGGCFYTFYREDATLGIGAELRFSGCAVGYDDGEDVTVYDIIFYTGTIHRGSYVYDTVPAEHILPLGQVPKRYYSEIVHQLTRATASSTATDEGWRSSRIDC